MYYNYIHTKPNTEVFYIGKGKDKRAWEFCRKNKHWNSVVNKYCKPIVTVSAYWKTEKQSLIFEKFLIASAKHFGFKLANKTDGGEGVSGMKHSDTVKDNQSKRVSGKNNPMFGVSLSGSKNGMFGMGEILKGQNNGRFISPITATNLKTGQKTQFVGKTELIKFGFLDSKVYACLNGRRKTHKGHTFERP